MSDKPRVLRPRPLRAFNSAFTRPAAADSLPPPPQFPTEASTTSPINPPRIISAQDNLDLDETTPECCTIKPASGVGGSDSSSSSSNSSSTTALSRSHSVFNLTSSALAGIFQPSLSSLTFSRYDSPALRDSRSTTSGGARAQTLLYQNGENIDDRSDESKSQDLFGSNNGDDCATTSAETGSGSGSSSKSYNDELARKASLWRTKRNISSTRQLKIHQHVTTVHTLRVLARLGLLFVLGIAYGLMVSRLHDGGRVAPVQVQGVNRSSWLYLCLWGCAGILLGTMMPWVDALWSRRRTMKMHKRNTDNLWEKWYAVVRSVGAFVGVAFAIRKLPWQSTLQLSVTLALANPALWYLLDRSSPGIFLSTLISLIGTITLLHLNPEMLPIVFSESSKERWITIANPGHLASDKVQDQLQNREQSKGDRDAGYPHHNTRFLLYEQIGVVTWIASVLFCSCVCLGNIGRRLVIES